MREVPAISIFSKSILHSFKVAVILMRKICGAAAPPYPLGATARTSRRSVFSCGKCGKFIKTDKLPQPPAPPALNIFSLSNVFFWRDFFACFHNLLCLRHRQTNELQTFVSECPPFCVMAVGFFVGFADY